MAETHAETPRQRLGRHLAQARIARGLRKGAAAKAAHMTQTTWMHIEKGTAETIDMNLAAAERVVGWAPGSADAIMKGGEPTLLPYANTQADPDRVVPNGPEQVSKSADDSFWRPGDEDEIRRILTDTMVHAIPTATGADIQRASSAFIEEMRRRGLVAEPDRGDG
ncbi:helix-turn-helix transcriptional regulator [Embleya sp. NPDC005971]|uniref:helix-turn-helix transcriptional regulator n=1 Tax=Embleya sp. NPDC005971 TaxID=3156724 RepID=UPI0034001281